MRANIVVDEKLIDVARRTAGVTVRKTIDVMIATSCIGTKLPLLYTDRGFDPMVDHFGLEPA